MNRIIKERGSNREPLFVKFINREISGIELLNIFARSSDKVTSEAAKEAIESPPDIEPFRKELTDAVRDIIKEGPDEDFKAFVNHYMESALIEDIQQSPSKFGENVSRTARVKDPESDWIQGMLCYNLCLYIKAFGLENLKNCRVCGKVFAHKGKYAVYCSDLCKTTGKQKKL